MPGAAAALRNGIEPHVWRIAIVVILGAIMSVLDTTIVNVALDTLARDLNTSLDTIQWVVSGYLLSLAAVIPITGWLGRRFGARRVFLTALVLFTTGSALCGLADSAGALIAFRILQGVGGGMLMPTGQMTLVKAAGPENLPRVMSMIGVPIILAPVFGPTLGGLLLEHVSWQSIFLVNVPVGIVAFVAAWRLLPRDEDERAQAGPLDLLGLGLVSTGLIGITYGLAETGSQGSLLAAAVVLPFLAGITLVTTFVLRALRIEHPLLDVRLYANRAFAAASLTTFALGAALFGAMILMPLYFQIVRGEGAVATGLLLAPQGIGAAIAMGLSGRATERWGGGRTALVGGLITLVATIPFVMLGGNTPYAVIDIAMVFRGMGIGFSMMPAMTAAFSVLRKDQVNDATPQLTTLQRVGGSIGTAVLSVVLQGHLQAAGPGASQDAMAAAFGTTFLWVMGITLVALLPTLVLIRAEREDRTIASERRGGASAEAAIEAAV